MSLRNLAETICAMARDTRCCRILAQESTMLLARQVQEALKVGGIVVYVYNIDSRVDFPPNRTRSSYHAHS